MGQFIRVSVGVGNQSESIDIDPAIGLQEIQHRDTQRLANLKGLESTIPR